MKLIANILLCWYAENKRDLPWRQTHDPYKIWLSEIILQQTQISTGLHYYNRILKRYPDVESLANADKNEFMKLWQGLGYYRRAENMLKAGQYVVKHYQGKFPADYYALLKLKGIGEYTAAAISSFAFGIAVPVVDGNVRRVISRLFDVAEVYGSSAFEAEIKSGVNTIFDDQHPAEFNQAIMELGALRCKKSPLCNQCPLLEKCLACGNNVQKSRPVKPKIKTRKTRHFHYVVMMQKNNTAILRRDDSDIWRSLYEFPIVELHDRATEENIREAVNQKYGTNLSSLLYIESFPAHVLSHQEIFAHVYMASGVNSIPGNMVNISKLKNYPVHRLMDKIINSKAVKSIISPCS